MAFTFHAQAAFMNFQADRGGWTSPASRYDPGVRLLVLEDDPSIREPLTASLREAGFAVDEAESRLEAESLALMYPYSAFVVDVRLPDGPNAGFEFVQSIRAQNVRTPVLFLTARDSLEDRVAGLDAGGDDYLTKPFHIVEVQARLRALLRRARPVPDTALERDGLRVDFNSRSVMFKGQTVHLTAKEYAILELLASTPGKLFERDQIIERVWDSEYNAETNVVDVYVKNLRKKIADWVVETVRGIGYRFPG
jgi:DNA-binding response OmpR family regulator